MDKMAAILKCIYLSENDRIGSQISLKFVPRSPVDNIYKPAWVQVMAWRWTHEKPLPGSMMAQFIDTYMRH